MQQRRLALALINTFIVLTAGALLFTVYLTIARATIRIPGERERFVTETVLTAGGSSEASSDVAAELIDRQYEMSETLPVAAQTKTSDKAGGIVTLINKYSRDQSLVKTTRLLTSDNKLFRITRSVNIPSGGSIEVFAEADEPGDEFLIGPTKFTIPGLWEGLQDTIYGESGSAMSYDRPGEAVVSEQDVQKVQESLTQKLKTRALAELSAVKPDTIALSEDALSVSIESAEVTPKVGTVSSTVTLKVAATVTAVMLEKTALAPVAEQVLREQLPNPDQFIELIPDGISYSVSSIDTNERTARLELKTVAWVRSATTVPLVDVSKLTGVSRSAAIQYLLEQGFTEPSIILSPSWQPWLPLLANHIAVEIQ